MNAYSIEISIKSDSKNNYIKEFEDKLVNAPQAHRYIEISIDHNSFPSILTLINDEYGWMLFFRYDGDAGFHTINKNYDGNDFDVLEYYLSNGQLDEYPAKYTLKEFILTRKVPEYIDWINDSSDGNKSPNDKFNAN
jgi:hypothetical protein